MTLNISDQDSNSRASTAGLLLTLGMGDSTELNSESEETVCEGALRQLIIVTNYIHYKLNRPLLPDRDWPQWFQDFHEDVRECLTRDEVPVRWIDAVLPVLPQEREARIAKYDSCRRPLFTPVSHELRDISDQLERIRSSAESFSRRSERGKAIKTGAERLASKVLRESWEVTSALGFPNI